jgi:hypothetical protein
MKSPKGSSPLEKKKRGPKRGEKSAVNEKKARQMKIKRGQ